MADENDAGNGESPRIVICWLAPAAEQLGALSEHLADPRARMLAIGLPLGAQRPESARVPTEFIELPSDATLAHLANRAAKHHANCDLVLVFPGADPPAAWLGRLLKTLASESTAATVSAIPAPREEDRRRAAAPLPHGASAAGPPPEVFAPDAVTSQQIRPRIASVTPTCIYIRRSAYELVGPLDETLRSSYASALDFALRARARGLGNLLADDLLVPAPAVELGESDELVLDALHPSLMRAIAQPQGPAVERSLAVVQVAREPISVTIDARALGPQVGGTQVYIQRLLESLATSGEVRLRTLVAPDLAGAVERRLRQLPATELLSYEQALARPEQSHVVHRPQQVFSADDLVLLEPLGRRMMITHHDLIAYHNPSYFSSFELWQRFLRTTRGALGTADHVLFFSNHALNDAVREDLVERSRTSVALLGAEPVDRARERLRAQAPSGAQALQDRPFLLCIGADYQHKNRPFALEVQDELRRTQGWGGMLVLAGPHVEHGSSAAEERVVRQRRGMGEQQVIDLGRVSDEERAWLMCKAAAVIYPTVHEGFGLVPFESAGFGIPCLFAAQSSLGELLDDQLAALVPWDPARSAHRAAPLLDEGVQRREHVAALSRAAASHSWADCASATIQAYRAAIGAPYRASAEGAWQALEREREVLRLDRGIGELNVKVRELREDLGGDAVALVGPLALLSRPEQHALLAVAARPALKRLLFGALRACFGVLRAVSRLAR